MKINLINPPLQVSKNYNEKIELYQPTGLLYIAASLEKAGYEVYVLDALIEDYKNEKIIGEYKFIGLDFKEIAKRVSKSEIIGITGMSLWKDSIFYLISEIKKLNKKCKIIVGGPYASWHPEECLKKGADFVVIGEGEITILELIKSIEKKIDKKNILGIAYKYKNKIIINKKRPFLQNLDEIPFPARHLIPMEKYFEAAKIYKYSRSQSKSNRTVSIITSRGCPFNCIFCSAFILSGKIWRFRSAENVVDEITECIKKYSVTDIYFEDENMSLNKERMEKICDMIIEKNLNITLHAPQGLRADTLDKNILIKMKKAGFKSITIAPETGSQRVMDEIIDKKIKLTKIEEVVKNCKEIGIKVACFFVIGMPGETKEEIEQTLRYAHKLRKIGAYHCTVRNAMPIPGTRMYKIAKEKGYLLKDGIELENLMYSTKKHLMKTEYWSPFYIENICKKAEMENIKDSNIKLINFFYAKKFIKGMIKAPKETMKIVMKRIKFYI
ncbi:MAG: radical SAM protein [Candidatus Aenigmatarchaeota archaeon]